MMRRSLLAAVALAALSTSGATAGPAGQTPAADSQRDYNAGRYNRAVDALNTAIAKTPDDASLHFLLGQSYYQLREYPRAVATLERAVQLSPKDSQFHDWLGRAYGRKAEESVFLSAMSWARKTHHEFEIAVELDPKNFEAQRDLIRFEINAPGVVGGGDDKALKHIGDLEKIDPIQGQLARGELFSTKKKMAEADAVFGKLLESDADKAGVFFEVSDYYRDRPDPGKMSQAIEKAERIDPEDRRLKFYKGTLLVIQKQNGSEAEMMLKSYIATVPDNSDLPSHAAANEWLGKLYESEKRFSEATEEYRLSLSLDPHNKSVEEALRRVDRK
jgi:tetratricopeptide (TPR) repeat protein